MTTRRRFLQQSAVVSLVPLVPAFLSRSLSAADAKRDERVLVVIQLDGGNDGLNTVIPYADEDYRRHRQELFISPDKVLKLNDAIGLHPQMKPAAQLFEDGRLAIVQGVGYPNPNRSHFESMAIWQHAWRDETRHDGIGWLGRTADLSRGEDGATPHAIYVGSEAVPVAVRGRRANFVSLENEADLKLAPRIAGFHPPLQTGSSQAINSSSPATADLSAFVSHIVAQSFDAAKRFSKSTAAQAAGSAGYPPSKLAQKLRLVSKLMQFGGGTRIYYVSQPGYDTHAAQSFQHGQLLRDFSAALKAFIDDLYACGLADRTIVVAFSEFGRHVEENASAGTDHGAAGPVFIAGASVAAGFVGDYPSLAALDQGDLMSSIDFRRIYATLLDQWLNVSSVQVLGERFEPLPLLRG